MLEVSGTNSRRKRYMAIIIPIIGGLAARALGAAPIEEIGEVRVSLELVRQEVPCRAPVPMTMKIQNKTPRDLAMLFDYVSAAGVEFTAERGIAATDRPRQPLNVSLQPTVVEGNREQSVTLYLNRFIEFKLPGIHHVAYRVRLPYYFVGDGLAEKNIRHLTASGTLRVHLLDATHEETRKDLERVAEALNSEDKEKRLEAAVALCYLDHPSALEFVAKVLADDSSALKIMAIQAISRLRSPEIVKALDGVLSPEADPAVLKVALGALAGQSKVLERDRVKALLGSKRDGVRGYTACYVARVGTAKDIPLLQPLLTDSNPYVARDAKAAIEKLTAKE